MEATGILEKNGLDEQDIADIRRLADICERQDGIRLKLNWDMLRDRPADETNDFLIYRDGMLAGFAGLYGFGGGEIELSGMMHPDYRRRGLFRSLVASASKAARSRSIANLIFIVPQVLEAGASAARSFGGEYSFSEYLMELTDRVPEEAPDSPVSLREAGLDDLDLLTRLNTEGFGKSPDESRKFIRSILTGPAAGYYAAAYLEHEPIGVIRVQQEPGEAFIYGFCISPGFRGRGYGRSILAQTVAGLQKGGAERVYLEVACENRSALGLYESVGFRIVQGIDYFATPLS